MAYCSSSEGTCRKKTLLGKSYVTGSASVLPPLRQLAQDDMTKRVGDSGWQKGLPARQSSRRGGLLETEEVHVASHSLGPWFQAALREVRTSSVVTETKVTRVQVV